MRSNKFLVVILVLGLILRLYFAFAVPVFDKPDEKPHFDYIRYIAENKSLPVQKQGQHGEFFQPPLYYIITSPILSLIDLFTENIYFLVVSMRILSVIFSMLTLLLIYKISSLIFKDRNLILGIVAFASFLPTYASMNSTITNANFSDFLATLITFIILLILLKETNKKILLMGLLVGIAFASRTSLIPVILTIPVAIFAKHYPNIKVNSKAIIKSLAIIAAISLVLAGWHFVRNLALYNDPLGINAMKIASPTDDIKLSPLFLARLLGWTFITFWASFGRTNNIFIGNLNSPSGIALFILAYSILLLVSFFALLGMYKFFINYRKNRNILTDFQKKALIIITFHLLLLGLFFVSFNLYDFQPQGRLFFPAISTIAVLFTLGVFSNFDKKNWEKILIYYTIFFILISIISIVSISHYYLLLK